MMRNILVVKDEDVNINAYFYLGKACHLGRGTENYEHLTVMFMSRMIQLLDNEIVKIDR